MPDNWEHDTLKALGAPITTGNLRLLRTWQRWEGGHTKNRATYNWLNTTRGKQFPAMNSVGVRAFPDYRTGVAYTADTILGGYPGMVMALRSGKPFTPKYRKALEGDLSKWVSGSRTARMDYAAKVLGTAPGVTQSRITPDRVTSRGAKQPMSRNALDLRALASALDDGDDFWDMVQATPIEMPEMAKPASKPHAMDEVPAVKGGFQVPLEWQGDHPTDNLGWGTQTAHDFILPAGTTLKVPESGKVIKWGSAQGGQSLWFKGDSGKVYWFGHIDKRAPVGRRLGKGARFGVVSADHATPHLHADVQ